MTFVSTIRESQHALMLVGTNEAQPIARHLEAAFTSADRRRGLLGRTSLGPDCALIIAPCWSVHTFFMRFTIDVVFVSEGGTVVSIRPRLTPWRLAADWGADATIELPEGVIERANIRAGDSLRLVQA
jgi:uncharacterized membrane protein (UPF0127 family)